MNTNIPTSGSTTDSSDAEPQTALAPITMEDFGHNTLPSPYDNIGIGLDVSHLSRAKRELAAPRERMTDRELERHLHKFTHVVRMGNRSARRYRDEEIAAGADPKTFPSAAALHRWKTRAATDDRGLAGYHFRAGRSIEVENGPLAFFIDCKANRKGTEKLIYELMVEQKDVQGWGHLHSLCTYRRWYKELPDSLRVQLEEGSKARFEKAGLVLPQPDVTVNHTWQCDAKQFPIHVLNPEDGNVYRPWIVAFIDCASRMIMGWHVTLREPTTQDVLIALKHALLPGEGKHWWARPKIIQTDRGSIFRARDYRGALYALGIGNVLTDRDCPSQNGKIEAFNGTLDDAMGAHEQHVLAKTKIYDRLKFHAIWTRFPAEVAKYICYYNLERPHKGIGLAAPFEIWRDGTELPDMTFEKDEVDQKVTVSRLLKMTRPGVEVIAGSGRFYTSGKAGQHINRKVVVTHPPEGPGRQICAFRRGHFIDFLVCPKDNPTLARDIKAADMGRVAAEMQVFKNTQARHESELRWAAKRELREAAKARARAAAEKKRKDRKSDALTPSTSVEIADSEFPNLRPEEN